MQTPKTQAEEVYRTCSPIGKLRESFPRCFISSSKYSYCIKSNKVLRSKDPSSSSSSTGESNDNNNNGAFTRANAFYDTFNAFKKMKGGDAKKELSLEEQLLAERFRASTDVDISSISCITATTTANKIDNDEKKKEKQTHSWILVKRPGQTLIWREEEEQQQETKKQQQLYDIFGDILKPHLPTNAAPMDLQLVSATFESVNTNIDSNASTSTSSGLDDEVTNWKWSFVSGGNIYLCSFVTTTASTSSASTSSSSTSSSSENDFTSTPLGSFYNAQVTPITTNGVVSKLEFGTADFIMAEEFGRYSGVFWSPNNKHLAFSGVDVSDTPQANMLRLNGSVESIPFPKIGEDNVVTNLYVVVDIDDVNKNNNNNNNNAKKLEFKMLPFCVILAALPWAEYITRVYWIGENHLAVFVLSRNQEKLSVVRVPISLLIPATENSNNNNPDMSLSPSVQLLMECCSISEKDRQERIENGYPSSKITDSNERLKMILEEIFVKNKTLQEQSSSITQECSKLLSSFNIIREENIPSAWIDTNDTFSVLPGGNNNNNNNKEEKEEVKEEPGKEENRELVCLASDMEGAGFFEVFYGKPQQENDNNNKYSWKAIPSNLPRGILSSSSKIFHSNNNNKPSQNNNKNSSSWLLARSFAHNGYNTSIVAIKIPCGEEKEEKESFSPQTIILTPKNHDVASFSILSSESKKKFLVYSFVVDGENERRTHCNFIDDLDSVLSSNNNNNNNDNTVSECSSSIPLQFDIDSTSSPSSSPTATSTTTKTTTSNSSSSSCESIPRPTETYFFEVPIPTKQGDNINKKPRDDEKLQAVFLAPQKNNNNNENGFPLYVYFYGGPHVSYCTTTMVAANTMFECMRRLGFGVLLCDSRMATRHSYHVNSDIKSIGFGQFEVSDILACVDHLLENCESKFGCKLDPKRVCCHGHSYGGFLSLLCIATAGDRFKTSCAGAPFLPILYDTGYTERYGGVPNNERSKQIYDQSDLSRLAKQFPDEFNRMFIFHGTMDENVSFLHTQRLVSELIKEVKPFNLLAYPGERHGIRNTRASAKHYTIMTMRAFLEFV